MRRAEAEPEIRPATLSGVDDCAHVLAGAFRDDPGAVVFDPDPARRAEMLPGFFRAFVAASLTEDADIIVVGHPIAGVASWFGPDRHGPSDGEYTVGDGVPVYGMVRPPPARGTPGARVE